MKFLLLALLTIPAHAATYDCVTSLSDTPTSTPNVQRAKFEIGDQQETDPNLWGRVDGAGLLNVYFWHQAGTDVSLELQGETSGLSGQSGGLHMSFESLALFPFGENVHFNEIVGGRRIRVDCDVR